MPAAGGPGGNVRQVSTYSPGPALGRTKVPSGLVTAAPAPKPSPPAISVAVTDVFGIGRPRPSTITPEMRAKRTGVMTMSTSVTL